MSDRDKKILAVTPILVLLAIYVLLFFLPSIREINSLKSEIKEASTTYDINQIYDQRIKNLTKEKESLRQRMSAIRSTFPPSYKYSEIMAILNKTASESGLTISDITISDIKQVSATVNNTTPTGRNTSADPQPNVLPPVKITDDKMAAFMKDLGLPGDEGLQSKVGVMGSAPITDGKGFVLGVKLNAVGTDRQVKEFLATVDGAISLP